MARYEVPRHKIEILKQYFEHERNPTLIISFMYAVLEKKKHLIENIHPIIIGMRTGIHLQWKGDQFERNWFDGNGMHMQHSRGYNCVSTFEEIISYNGHIIDEWWWIDFHMETLNPNNYPYYGDGNNVKSKIISSKELNPTKQMEMFGEVEYI